MKISLDRLLHLDGLAALTAGVLLILVQDFANLTCSAYSLPLARRKHRPERMVRLRLPGFTFSLHPFTTFSAMAML